MKLLGAELKNWIQISVKHDWNLRFVSNLTDTIENAADRGPASERALGGQLIHNSVRQWIREGQSKLEQIGPGLFQSKRQIDGSPQIRIAGADVRNESFAVF